MIKRLLVIIALTNGLAHANQVLDQIEGVVAQAACSDNRESNQIAAIAGAVAGARAGQVHPRAPLNAETGADTGAIYGAIVGSQVLAHGPAFSCLVRVQSARHFQFFDVQANRPFRRGMPITVLYLSNGTYKAF